MCGTPNCLSRTIVTPSRGWIVDSTSSGFTPKVASLKKFGSWSCLSCGEKYRRSVYMWNWSSKCGGREPSVLKRVKSAKLSSPFSPGGSTLRKPPESFVPYAAGSGPLAGSCGGGGGGGAHAAPP